MAYRALVVEDDQVTQLALMRILEAEGLDVDRAGDGGPAIKLLSERDYDVVLLDIVLPTVSGTIVMEHLRQTRPAMLERVIVVSGLDVQEIRTLFPAVCEALAKPVFPARLRAVVRDCIEGASQADTAM